MTTKIPRVVIAGLSGDSGKTTVTLSILAALRQRGLTSAPFKKGPDYIDPAWLGQVSGGVCRNLDTWLIAPEVITHTFATHASQAGIAVIEGNRGLFDGKDVEGSHSTAGLARLLQAPVVLVIDATKSTRTIAALVAGCQGFEPETQIAGVILNNVAGKRHREIITEAITTYCRLPVLGCLPKLGRKAELIPGRHLGLVPPTEFFTTNHVTDELLSIAENYIDIDRIIDIANAAPALNVAGSPRPEMPAPDVRIGYFSDEVFTFYYPENLEALSTQGAELVKISSLTAAALPNIDALYIGGGFPETFAVRLAENTALLMAVRQAAEAGLPIYAECGGLMYLCRSLTWQNTTVPLAGVFDIDIAVQDKPAGHGYVEAAVDTPNPYFAQGVILRGHEFHYSSPMGDAPAGCLALSPGRGLGNGRDGLTFKRTMACYTHLHASGTPQWADAVLDNARAYASERNHTGTCRNGRGRSSGACLALP